jgi:superfamily I DNA/RNA helicase
MGPARVAGSAGTGKTIVALHRAAHLARAHPDARVLLTTFSDTLANALRTKLKRLLGNEPRLGERIDVHSLDAIGLRLYKTHVGQATIASGEIVRELVQEAASAVGGHKFGLHFLLTEWEQVVDAWQLDDWEAYRDVVRLGRKTRIPEPQRKVLWSIFERVRAGLRARRLITHAQLCRLGGRSSERPLFRWRPRAAHLPATLLMEGPGRRYSGAFTYLARQLPHVPPNPHAGRPPSWAGGD